jgi:hypothetical protein
LPPSLRFSHCCLGLYSKYEHKIKITHTFKPHLSSFWNSVSYWKHTHINIHIFFLFTHSPFFSVLCQWLSADVLWGSEYKKGYMEWNMQIKILKIQKLIKVHFIQIHNFKNQIRGLWRLCWTEGHHYIVWELMYLLKFLKSMLIWTIHCPTSSLHFFTQLLTFL